MQMNVPRFVLTFIGLWKFRTHCGGDTQQLERGYALGVGNAKQAEQSPRKQKHINKQRMNNVLIKKHVTW